MTTYKTPGVYREERLRPPPREPLRTGVPAFLGFTTLGAVNQPESLRAWPQFEDKFGTSVHGGYLHYAVRGFYENQGELCRVVRLDSALPFESALKKGLEALATLDDIDLVVVPDIATAPSASVAASLQQTALDHCERSGDRFAILDSWRDASSSVVLTQRRSLSGISGALYYPWIHVVGGPPETSGFVPPSGHVAGIFQRSDERIGVHKAPANEIVEGALDLERSITNADQEALNPEGVNCLRSFAGRGIRVWGARTLAGQNDAEWQYINVRRLFLTAIRWIDRNLRAVAFEPNDLGLWARIGRELTAYFQQLFDVGALKGSTPKEAFYVKCDAETNPEEVRDQGMVVTEIGLAPALPGEFIVVRIIHGASGVTLETSATPASPVFQASPGGAVAPRSQEVKIANIVYNPRGPDIDKEHVRIENPGLVPVDLKGWTLSDLNNHQYVFPRFTLAPGESVRLWTRSGADSETDLYWGRRVAVWSNIGDRARLRNSSGVVVDTFTYTPIDSLLLHE